ncbi:MAG: hypothetical protein QXJ75_06460, partial [Candidatus Bathyarchaeia archaeon]
MNELNRQIAALREEAAKSKKLRDELNTKVKELKQNRDKLKAAVEEKHEVYKKMSEKIAELEKNVSMSAQLASKKFNELEWKLQTTSSLGVKDERQIIDQIKEIERQLAVHKFIKDLKQKALDIKSEIESLRLQMKISHAELSKAAEESQKNHQVMIDTLKRVDELRAELENNRKTFAELKTKADKIHNEYIAKISQRKALERQLSEFAGDAGVVGLKKALE